ncbi:MAG: glycine--tRNA ligase subunit beta [Candidatus Aminicenantes bacterium]|nr:MAG: glycine--tRNA ligase subunit beta [Candidatus Aminicenantes bacterium]
MSDFLFELGVEEVPVSEIKSILHQLKQKFQYKLQEHLVEFSHIETAATNKRFMIYINKINKKANDKEEQLKGPAKRIAYDENNQPTVPLKKFMEFNQVEPGDLSEMETPKGIYMVVNKKTEGLPTFDILRHIIPEILKELIFSKTMVWNASRVPFVRPIKTLLGLLEHQVIPFEFAGIHSENFTFGHILLSDEPIEVNSFRDYCEKLDKNFVIVREEERKEKIINEIKEIEEDQGAHVQLDNRMLEEFIYNNEYPVVFCGKFEKKYLDLPAEIISTFMVKEKKLLPVYDKNKNLLNIFVGVSNIPDEGRHVVTGNERVIRATFEDAKFFWDNDRKDDFIALRDQLKNVMFHKDLGNYYEKTERLSSFVEFLLKETGLEYLSQSLKKAALHCKNDLVTRMVREFPSLQGIMGALYMKEKGETDSTWKSVYGHYEPKGFHTVPLDHLGAGILSIADKIDNITAFISKGIKISSSKDPYGIRRDANGIIKIIIDFKLDFNLDGLIRLAAAEFSENDQDCGDLIEKVSELFFSRLENVYKDFLKIRYDVVNAVLNREDLWIYRMYLKAGDVSKIVETASIESLTTLHKRLKNIIKDSPPFNVSADTLVEKQEKILFDIFNESSDKIEHLLSNHEYLQACSQFLEMKPVIDNFFDNVLVMAEDQKLRENRIALVQQLDQLLSQIADFSLVVE